MTLLCELTDKYSEKNYFNALNGIAKSAIPIIYGHHLYSFLYNYFSGHDNKVTSIDIIRPENKDTEKLFQIELKNYSPEFTDHEEAWDIADWIPPVNQLKDERLKLKISNMIRNARFVEAKPLAEEKYLIYLPLCGEIFFNQILNQNNNCNAYTDGRLAHLDDKTLIQVNQNKLYNNYQKLIELNNDCQRILNENGRSARKFKVSKEYVSNFRKPYQDDLEMIKFNSDLQKQKELYFFGAENFTAKKGLDFLFGDYNYNEYNLLYGLEKLDRDDKAYVFLNFHSLFNQSKQNNLADIIKESKTKNHVVIQGDNIQLISYFGNYKKIRVPNDDEIREQISGVFLSLLINERKFRVRDNDWRLYPIINNNLLLNILTNATNPEALSKTMRDFSEIKMNDLNNNTSFWAVFLEKYENVYKQISEHKIVVHATSPVDKWIINVFENNEYEVLHPTYYSEPKKISIFLINLILLIKYTELGNKSMHYIDLRRAAQKYKGKEIKAGQSSRTTVENAFTRAISENEWFEKFFEKYITPHDSEYTFDIQNIDLEIHGFELATDFFDNL